MNNQTSDPTKRFSSRVADYVRYRPSYPGEVIELLKKECALTSDSVVADIGSGTGLLAVLFLKNGNKVIGVEPNRKMREAGERVLAEYTRFVSVDGTAEATGLTERSVDFVTAGQAFHWFDRDKARAEFSRILKPGGWVVLVWNSRQTDTTPFLKAYEGLLLRYGTDYQAIRHDNLDERVIGRFFEPGGFKKVTSQNKQVFDFEGLKGRLLSSSYTPQPGHPDYEPMLADLRAIFEEYQTEGKVAFEYVTEVYYGHLK